MRGCYCMEQWKDYIGFEGLYQVSSYGRFRSLDRVTIQYNNGTITQTRYKGKLLNPSDRGRGYVRVHLSKNGKSYDIAVHRAVAEMFCKRPEGCDIVNHIDNNPGNNHAENLEWTTYKGNMQWSTKQGRMHYNPQNLLKAQKSKYKPIIAVCLKDGSERLFKSQVEAAEALKVTRSHIGSICKGQYGYKSSKGYSFRYATKEEERIFCYG